MDKPFIDPDEIDVVPESFHFTVAALQAGARLDKLLATLLEGETLSRERLQTLIAEGYISVNTKPVIKAALRLKADDRIEVRIPALEPLNLLPEDLGVPVVYEDADLLVVNKPTGMLTHPTGRETTGTLVNAMLHHCGNSLSGINGIIRPGIVHRLDRDTSGLLMIAKTDFAHAHLSAQLKAKTARRQYYAIAQGLFPTDTGTIDAPIGRNPKHRDKMMIAVDGRNAVTHWTVLDTNDDRFSKVALQLETGRTHQIRVHLSHIGHPILGDPLYGSGVEKSLRLKTHGQSLQAYRLTFQHPVSGETVSFELPEDPEMTRMWDTLTGLSK